MKYLFILVLSAAFVLPASAGVVRTSAKVAAKTAKVATHTTMADAAKDTAKGAAFVGKETFKGAKFFFTKILF